MVLGNGRFLPNPKTHPHSPNRHFEVPREIPEALQQMSIPKHDLPIGWFSATDEESERLQNELNLEMTEGDPLHGVPIRIVAHRDGTTDDVLCKILDVDDHYAVVHLTWSMKPEINEKHPTIEYRGTFFSFP
jgi:hypothetical protein